ncbi:MAG: DNA mismatch repair protein MutS [Holosporales bacterium]|nr:DNA mismatch repair protein MutS [Holosporales bacterium]
MQPDHETTATPSVKQYIDVKSKHEDCLLFYRMGDFFELFFEDAVIAAKELDIALTKRGKHADQDIPMCGVPVHSYDVYVSKLIQKGYRVAICDQIETPEEAKKRGEKGPLRREVVRIVTMGTLTEDELLPSGNNYIVAISLVHKATLSAAIADISTGFFCVESFPTTEINNLLEKWTPAEIIIPDDVFSNFMPVFEPFKTKLTLLPKPRFNETNAQSVLESTYNVKTVDVFGKMQASEIQAAGVLIDYIKTTQCNRNVSFRAPKIVHSREFMTIDASTRKNLEIYAAQTDKGTSLFATINHTVTPAGRRLLHNYLTFPLLDIPKIEQRLDYIDFFIKKQTLRDKIRENLAKTPDIERIISRLSFGRASPRDLLFLKIALNKSNFVAKIFNDDEISKQWKAILEGHTNLLSLLEKAMMEEAPTAAHDGNFINDTFDETLQEYRRLRNHASDEIKNMQDKYIQQTGINNLRIKRNNIWGFYIEVSSGQVSKIPFNFVHRQTLTNCIRYTTQELVQLEKNINDAEKSSISRELELFTFLCKEVLGAKDALLELSQTIAEVDIYTSMAFWAQRNSYVRPKLVTERIIDIKDGRHPVIEQVSAKQEANFVANDCQMSEDARRFLLVTGPNMAGKSTYLRQNALLIIMAQAGLFVPAKKATIGIVDRIFSRIGSSDDIASGRSTFMVEMIETAAILHQSTRKSFVILDEIGRGTATYDGLAIAWAVSEYLYNAVCCRTIFATHYHEITELTKNNPAMIAVTAAVKEWDGKIVFLHKITDGVAKRSYGIHVAQLAGLPRAVILRATELLNIFEKEDGELLSSAKKTKCIEKAAEQQKNLF